MKYVILLKLNGGLYVTYGPYDTFLAAHRGLKDAMAALMPLEYSVVTLQPHSVVTSMLQRVSHLLRSALRV